MKQPDTIYWRLRDYVEENQNVPADSQHQLLDMRVGPSWMLQLLSGHQITEAKSNWRWDQQKHCLVTNHRTVRNNKLCCFKPFHSLLGGLLFGNRYVVHTELTRLQHMDLIWVFSNFGLIYLPFTYCLHGVPIIVLNPYPLCLFLPNLFPSTESPLSVTPVTIPIFFNPSSKMKLSHRVHWISISRNSQKSLLNSESIYEFMSYIGKLLQNYWFLVFNIYHPNSTILYLTDTI